MGLSLENVTRKLKHENSFTSQGKWEGGVEKRWKEQQQGNSEERLAQMRHLHCDINEKMMS